MATQLVSVYDIPAPACIGELHRSVPATVNGAQLLVRGGISAAALNAFFSSMAPKYFRLSYMGQAPDDYLTFNVANVKRSAENLRYQTFFVNIGCMFPLLKHCLILRNIW